MNNPARVSFPIRLNRYLALCAVASRRNADELVTSGRVSVNGRVELSPGAPINEGYDVRADGRPVEIARPVYIVMNKPRGVLSAVSDARGKTVIDLLPERYRALGLFPAGRLDLDSEGLIILTNDGQFAQSIVHPSSGVKKTYLVLLRDILEEKKMKEWAKGVIIDGKLTAPSELSRETPLDGRRWRVVLGEGFKREIRLMAEALGNRVIRLKRVGIGEMFLKKLPNGMFYEYHYRDLLDIISNGGEI
ncbi:MAG: rRNA pseudouridine synthase [Synergistaceae bacterium]|jgi:23S rRNA pseudouridine2605 synthase|nr:rRNA pseudouridine synthase [Synergistaceae bacterium]